LTEIYLCHACSCQAILRTETAGQARDQVRGLRGLHIQFEGALQCCSGTFSRLGETVRGAPHYINSDGLHLFQWHSQPRRANQASTDGQYTSGEDLAAETAWGTTRWAIAPKVCCKAGDGNDGCLSATAVCAWLVSDDGPLPTGQHYSWRVGGALKADDGGATCAATMEAVITPPASGQDNTGRADALPPPTSAAATRARASASGSGGHAAVVGSRETPSADNAGAVQELTPRHATTTLQHAPVLSLAPVPPSPVTAASSVVGQKAVITTSVLPSSTVELPLQEGQEVTVLDSASAHWWRVRCGEQEGFVSPKKMRLLVGASDDAEEGVPPPDAGGAVVELQHRG
jgi:hypothetical protein